MLEEGAYTNYVIKLGVITGREGGVKANFMIMIMPSKGRLRTKMIFEQPSYFVVRKNSSTYELHVVNNKQTSTTRSNKLRSHAF